MLPPDHFGQLQKLNYSEGRTVLVEPEARDLVSKLVSRNDQPGIWEYETLLILLKLHNANVNTVVI